MLVCHHDVTSPAAAVAVLRLQRLADQGGAVAFQGLDVLGLDVAIPPTLDQLEELDTHAARAAELGLTLHRPTRRPPTLAAHLVAELAEEVGRGEAWRLACLRAYWQEDADLGADRVLVDLAGGAGLPRDRTAALLADRRARVELRRRMLLTRGRGVGGVPVLEYAGTFVGADLSDADLRQLVAV